MLRDDCEGGRRIADEERVLSGRNFPGGGLAVVARDVRGIEVQRHLFGRAGSDYGRLREGAEALYETREDLRLGGDERDIALDDIRARDASGVADSHGHRRTRVVEAADGVRARHFERRVGQSVAKRIPHRVLEALERIRVHFRKVEVAVAHELPFLVRDLARLPAVRGRIEPVGLRPRVDRLSGRIDLPGENVGNGVSRRLAEERDEDEGLDRIAVHEGRVENSWRIKNDDHILERGACVGEETLLLLVQTPSARRLGNVLGLSGAASDDDDALLGALPDGELREVGGGDLRLVEAAGPLEPVAVDA